MKRLMISAMASGSGKTVLTCGLLAALTARGHVAQALKCGPDYIDPMFHEKVLGVPSRNLDLFLQGEDGVRRTLLKQKGDYVVVEGAMGFYDGVNGTDRASAWQVARAANLPVVLAIRPGGSSLTLAAQVRGWFLLLVGPLFTPTWRLFWKKRPDCRFWVTSLPWRRQTLAAVILAC